MRETTLFAYQKRFWLFKVLTAAFLLLASSVSGAQQSCHQVHQDEASERRAFFMQHPKFTQKLRNTVAIISRAQEVKYFDDVTFRGKTNLEVAVEDIQKAESKLSPKDLQAAQAVARELHNVEKWKPYAQRLYYEAGRWISKFGSEKEKLKLREEGRISQRSMLVILTQRARARGETIGKVKERLTTEQFMDVTSKGPFMDKAFSLDSEHGQVAHWLQMDFIAPLLKKHYGENSSAFYRAIVSAHLWTPIFDSRQHSFASPLGFKQVMSEVLPTDSGNSIYLQMFYDF